MSIYRKGLELNQTEEQKNNYMRNFKSKESHCCFFLIVRRRCHVQELKYIARPMLTNVQNIINPFGM